MKKNDELYCHTTCIISGNNTVSLTKGKIYKIIKIKDYQFIVLDNHNDEHTFSYSCYENWFYSQKDYRKNKLKQIEERI